MNLSKLSFLARPFRSGKTDKPVNALSRSESTFAGRSIDKMSHDEILSCFDYSNGEAAKHVLLEGCRGAKSFASKGWKIGAAAGAIAGIATNVVASINFPPSIIAITLSGIIGAAKGAAIGLAVGATAGFIVKTAGALYDVCRSPESRLRRAAKKGAKELKDLQKKAGQRKPLTSYQMQRLDFLEKHVEFWDKAAQHFAKQKTATPDDSDVEMLKA